MATYISQSGFRDTYISATQGGFTKQPEPLQQWGRGSYDIHKDSINKSHSPQRIHQYHPDGTGRDTYVSYENGGSCFQQPVAYQQNTFQNKLRLYNGSALYKARNYNHPKRKMEIEENSFVEMSPQIKKGRYLKDINDEITLKPFNLFKQKTAEIGVKTPNTNRLDNVQNLRASVQNQTLPIQNQHACNRSMADLQSYQSIRLSVPKRLEPPFEISSNDKLMLTQSFNWENTPSRSRSKQISLNLKNGLRGSYSVAERKTQEDSINVTQSSRKKLQERKHFSNMLKYYSTQPVEQYNTTSNKDVRVKKKKVQNILNMLEERTQQNKKGQIPVLKKNLSLKQNKNK